MKTINLQLGFWRCLLTSLSSFCVILLFSILLHLIPISHLHPREVVIPYFLYPPNILDWLFRLNIIFKKQSPPFHPPIRPTLTATSLSNLFQNPSNRLLEDKKKSKTALAPRRYELGCILRILLFSDAISNKCCFHLTSYIT